MRKITAAALAVMTITGAGFMAQKIIDPFEHVAQVVDGDTFFLTTNHQTVRLFGLDAPELSNCFGQESLRKLDQLLAGKKVQLKEPMVDHFGRIVALVYVKGRLINEVLIREGYAAYQSEPGSGKEIMKLAHAYAISHKLGIYSPVCTDTKPPDPKCAIKGNHDLDRDANLYLLPGCPYYSQVQIRRFEGDRWFCTEKEAKKAGFTISSACALGTSAPKLP